MESFFQYDPVASLDTDDFLAESAGRVAPLLSFDADPALLGERDFPDFEEDLLPGGISLGLHGTPPVLLSARLDRTELRESGRVDIRGSGRALESDVEAQSSSRTLSERLSAVGTSGRNTLGAILVPSQEP